MVQRETARRDTVRRWWWQPAAVGARARAAFGRLSRQFGGGPGAGGAAADLVVARLAGAAGDRLGVASRLKAWLVQPRRLGLPGKLLMLTTGFVMLAEVLIFVPSVANYRVGWLSDRLTAAELAALAAGAIPGGAIPAPLRSELLRTAEVKAVALRRNGQRRLVLPAERTMVIDDYYDLRVPADEGWLAGFSRRLALNADALVAFFHSGERTLRVTGPHGDQPGDFIEIVIPEAPLKAAMIQYGLNVLGLSIIISLITAALVYIALSWLLVQPMLRITRSMVQFSQDPEDGSRVIVPSGRTDEIGTAEHELAQMQRQLAQALLQKNRLAQLGLAVSKINHDLRNMLASAQLMSDRLTSVPDATVQRFAPKLIAALDRAIAFCNSSLAFGKAEEAAPRRDLMRLRPLIEEVGDALGLPREGQIGWTVDIDAALCIDADREHLYRILSNLVRNAVQAIEMPGAGKPGEVGVRATRVARLVEIVVSDNGPGVPAKARSNLFRAFQGSSKKGGSGLGLAIAAELVAAHGGRIRLLDTESGAAFLIEIPDRGQL